MTVQEFTRDLRSRLTGEYGSREASAMVKLVFAHLKGWSPTDMVIHAADGVSEFLASQAEGIVSRVQQGEPIQYVLGLARFYGMDLEVNPSVLIPRPETEELVDMIVTKYSGRKDLRILDIGTGSGAIAIALAKALPFSRVTALDVSPLALETARRNACRMHVDVDFLQADVFDWESPEGTFDIVVSNPPYIPEEEKEGMERNVLAHEPALALFVSDADPLLYYRRITHVAAMGLHVAGGLYFEINPRFADGVASLMERAGFVYVELTDDISGRARFVSGVKEGKI